MKITKGDWEEWGHEDFIVSVRCKSKGKHVTICSMALTGSVEDQEEQNKNAALIAEAGTVHNETGLMPRELVKQRDKLAWLLEQIITDLPTNKDWLNPDIEADAKALIERIK